MYYCHVMLLTESGEGLAILMTYEQGLRTDLILVVSGILKRGIQPFASSSNTSTSPTATTKR
jgi:hypothetical protein